MMSMFMNLDFYRYGDNQYRNAEGDGSDCNQKDWRCYGGRLSEGV